MCVKVYFAGVKLMTNKELSAFHTFYYKQQRANTKSKNLVYFGLIHRYRAMPMSPRHSTYLYLLHPMPPSTEGFASLK